MPIAQSRIWSRPTAMKCSSGVYIQPYVASSAYALGHDPPVADPLGLAVDLEPGVPELLDLRAGQAHSSVLLDGQGHRRAVLDRRPHCVRRDSSGCSCEQHDLVGVLVEAEDVGRLALAHLVRPGTARCRATTFTAAHRPRRSSGAATPSSTTGSRPPPVPRPPATAGCELDDHLRGVVAVALRRLGHLELVVAQDHREDRLDLHHREGVADAAVLAGAERDPGPPVLQVLLARVEVAARVERRRARGSPRRSGWTPAGWRATMVPGRDRGGRPISISSWATRSRRISGGCSRSVSFSAASSRGIERSAWKETSERRRRTGRRAPRRPRPSRRGAASARSASTPRCPSEVWCPANIIEMNMPVM